MVSAGLVSDSAVLVSDSAVPVSDFFVDLVDVAGRFWHVDLLGRELGVEACLGGLKLRGQCLSSV